MKPGGGFPVTLPDCASNFIHGGKGAPFAKVAVSDTLVSLRVVANASCGIFKLKLEPARTLSCGTGRLTSKESPEPAGLLITVTGKKPGAGEVLVGRGDGGELVGDTPEPGTGADPEIVDVMDGVCAASAGGLTPNIPPSRTVKIPGWKLNATGVAETGSGAGTETPAAALTWACGTC